jgi:hypothetical protein
MEPEYRLLRSKQPVTASYPNATESIPTHCFFKDRINIFFPSPARLGLV